jgi:hypothetical protein
MKYSILFLISFLYFHCASSFRTERHVGYIESLESVPVEVEVEFITYRLEPLEKRKVLYDRSFHGETVSIKCLGEKSNEYFFIREKEFEFVPYIFYNTLGIPFTLGTGFLIDPFLDGAYSTKDIIINGKC